MSPSIESDAIFPLPEAASPPAPVPDAPLRRLAASLAHNVNNALTGVVGYLEMAREQLPPGAAADPHVRAGLECAYRAADAVQRIVRCAGRVAAAEAAAPQSLPRLTEQALERLSRATPLVTASVVGSSTEPAFVSAELVGDALEELLYAAAESAPGRGPLTLRVADEDGRPCLYVEGVDAGLPSRLTEASLFIEIHGGTLEVLDGPDGGASLRLSFPGRQEPPARRDRPQTAPLGLFRKAV